MAGARYQTVTFLFTITLDIPVPMPQNRNMTTMNDYPDRQPHLTTCPCCKDVEILILDERDVTRWQSGTLIQDAFPYLTPAERERLITGYCPECWDFIFGEDF